MKHLFIIIFLISYCVAGLESTIQLSNIVPSGLSFELWFLFSSFVVSFIFVIIFFFQKIWSYNPETDIFKKLKENDYE